MSYRIIIMVLAGVLSFSTARADETQKNNADTYRLLNLFGDVFERVRADYVDKVSDEKLIEAAISGMMVSLDPHSSYLNAKNFRDMRVNTSGEFGGLGIEVTMEKGVVKVVSPIDGTPAFRAGIEPGDYIIKLDGTQVQGMTLSEAVDKMRGRVGTDIVLTIIRKGRDPFEVTITRDIVKIRSVRSRIRGKIGYLRITSFNEQADKGIKKAMKEFKDKLGSGLQGIVLDLRNNPGGLLNQAVSVSDAFLSKGEIVSTRSRRSEDTQRFNSHPGDLADGLPMVVLVNGGSASASEIVAGALQDHRRAIILGTKSFGKGSVQTIIPISGQGAMRLTTARYFTPSGRSIQAIGIVPDIIVEQAKIENIKHLKRRHEADLPGALENPNAANNGNKPKKGNGSKSVPSPRPEAKAGKGDKKSRPKQDYQLDRALDLLRGISLFSGRMSANAN